VELSYHVLQVNNPRKDETNLILLIHQGFSTPYAMIDL
jgi:hypothetical protein